MSIPLKILRMIHARASGGAAIIERVVDSEQNLRTLHARASGHAALRTGVGPWENEALVWGLFTFEYFDVFDPCFDFLIPDFDFLLILI